MIQHSRRMALILFLTVQSLAMQAQPDSVLSRQDQRTAAIAALTAVGNLEGLKPALHAGLNDGLTVNEIKEMLTQLYAYCGFPRSLNATNVFMQVMKERKAEGKNDAVGKPIVQNDATDRYEQGRKVLETLSQKPQPRPAPGFGEFVPRTDAFLKEHLFADVFSSDVLSYRQRELVTISALAAMEGVEPQLQSHLGIGKNTGITTPQLQQLAGIIESNVSRTQANVLRRNVGMDTVPLIDADMLVRIAEVEVHPQYVQQYLAFAKSVSDSSVRAEPGVVSVFPMQTKENPNLVRIVEIYKNKEAYNKHIASSHFQRYKTGTPHMIKSLKLVDMNMLNPGVLHEVFRKAE